jgi:hypothetical protein
MDTIFDEESSSRQPSRWTIAVAVLAALLLTASVTGGYFYLRKRHAEAEALKLRAANPPAEPAPSPKVEAVEDEAKIKGANALIAGTIKNISPDRIVGLSLEFALTKRSGGETETKTVPLTPSDLDPGAQGTYSFTLSRDYRSVKLVHVRSADGKSDLPFRQVTGARRPLEGPPATKIIIVPRPSNRSGGEEFINTPDNPSRVP